MVMIIMIIRLSRFSAIGWRGLGPVGGAGSIPLLGPHTDPVSKYEECPPVGADNQGGAGCQEQAQSGSFDSPMT